MKSNVYIFRSIGVAFAFVGAIFFYNIFMVPYINFQIMFGCFSLFCIILSVLFFVISYRINKKINSYNKDIKEKQSVDYDSIQKEGVREFLKEIVNEESSFRKFILDKGYTIKVTALDNGGVVLKNKDKKKSISLYYEGLDYIIEKGDSSIIDVENMTKNELIKYFSEYIEG